MKKVTVVIPMDDETADRVNKLAAVALMASNDEAMCTTLREPIIKELFRILEDSALEERIKWRVH